MNPTMSSAAASGGVSGAAVVVLVWVLGTMHVTLPPDVAAAIMVLLAPLLHYSGLWMAAPGDDPSAPAAPTPRPAPMPAPEAPSP